MRAHAETAATHETKRNKGAEENNSQVRPASTTRGLREPTRRNETVL